MFCHLVNRITRVQQFLEFRILQIQLMHNYSVLNRFTTKTRVGNWYQEAQLSQFNFKEHLHNKNNGLNQTLNSKTKLGFSNQKKELTPYQDGLVRYGDFVSFGNQTTEAVLSFNINESILGQETYAVTTAKSFAPSLRNVFTITCASESGDKCVRYGDKIRIETEVGGKKLYLQSIVASPMRSSKFSRFQEVSVTADLSSNTLWTIEHFDPKIRFDGKGAEVVSGEVLLIKHCTTGQWLASDKVTYINNFGKEFEVYGKSWFTNNKTQNLISEKVGHISPQNPLKNQDLRNGWRIFKGK